MAERTLKEQNEKITMELSRYLRLTSPFTVWSHGEEPVIRVSRVDNYHRTAADIELLQLKGSFVQSDYFYLMASACLQYATAPAICSLVRFWNRKEVVDATKENREKLIIPEPTEAHASRMRDLCRKGVMTRYDCMPNPAQFPASEDDENLRTVIPVYRVNGVGSGIYSTALEKRPVKFNLQTAFYTEAEIMRWVQNSILTASFLNLPYVKDAKFVYEVKLSYKRLMYMSYLTVENESNPAYNCNLILESIVLNTNEKIVPKKSRIEESMRRVKDLVDSIQEMESQSGRTHFLVFCVEDSEGLAVLRQALQACGGERYAGKILVTSGTILYAKQVAEPEYACDMKESFLEYQGKSFSPATGYYFLHSEILNSF